MCLLQQRIVRTAEYLKTAVHFPRRRPYTVAIVSYALALQENSNHYNPLKYLMKAAALGIVFTQPSFVPAGQSILPANIFFNQFILFFLFIFCHVSDKNSVGAVEAGFIALFSLVSSCKLVYS